MKRTNLKKTKSINRWGGIPKTGAGEAAYATWKREVALPYLLSQGRKICFFCGTDQNVQVGHILPRSTHPQLKMELTNIMFECLPHNYYGVCNADRSV